MPKAAFYTLGCKVNQVETEQIKEEFIKKGYKIVDFSESADVYVINTCTVTHISDRKSRAVIRRAVRRNPEAIVAVVGCLAQIDAEQIGRIEGVDLIVGNKEKYNIASIIDDYNLGRQKKVINPVISSKDKLNPVIYTYKHERTRAFIKIQDGCQSFCSYCIVPYARGPVRSKLPEVVLSEVRQLIDLGYKEIVFTGIHTGMYGIDLKGWNLGSLLKFILDEVKGEYRIRLSSIEPLELNEELCKFIKEEKRLCRHLHIPLQSGSNKVLKDMNRRYTREYYRDLIMKIAEEVPGIAFTADVMVGFPTETEKDFEDTYELLNSLPVYDLHVFKYSRRPGTKAAQMISAVTEEEKQKRSEELIKLADKKRTNFISRFLGHEIMLLVERKWGIKSYIGLSDNYIEVEFFSENDLTGELTKVRIEKIEDGKVYGSLILDNNCCANKQQQNMEGEGYGI
ncbi:tRNA (N(6)-L-threonylcarbamoyladenosine(37)-C(2))-methylthiotransferase MtaB [Thermosyntropha sp.]|uniref:tRNA (N(6)-L-threonylcarbamoyladenosine(37)-C(2))- methylthiotransferase MtaB n=1 Tax=Thermosyntropha sp. TaxID=2740820 RepID=UPI0025CC8C61|nr:tRNA (N(6)-L-threonylcarbamoyladenosine(37)-C(2))-methylthiotransferase MtaB [Thermosyntropha sp.]MBO8159150.1 tRNA (N(6)-L-threonylcarbamoyladenosine(37)-C(2))-methylthiotransferase MtaB [Thermosyntropha sp.]